VGSCACQRCASAALGANGANKGAGTAAYATLTKPCQVMFTFKVSLAMIGTWYFWSAPMAWPDRMAPAEATANAGMNENELICITTIKAANTVVRGRGGHPSRLGHAEANRRVHHRCGEGGPCNARLVPDCRSGVIVRSSSTSREPKLCWVLAICSSGTKGGCGGCRSTSSRRTRPRSSLSRGYASCLAAARGAVVGSGGRTGAGGVSSGGRSSSGGTVAVGGSGMGGRGGSGGQAAIDAAVDRSGDGAIDST
jgi:hypothetical protein